MKTVTAYIFPNGIRRIRKARGFTLQALEAATGIPNAQISRAERHNYGISRKKLEVLAQVLGVKTYELYIPDDHS